MLKLKINKPDNISWREFLIKCGDNVNEISLEAEYCGFLEDGHSEAYAFLMALNNFCLLEVE